MLSAATNTMEKGRRRKNKNKKNNFFFWTLVLSLFFFVSSTITFPFGVGAFLFLIKCGQGLIDYLDIIIILDVNRTWILTHRRR
jgi:hypothetical protein